MSFRAIQFIPRTEKFKCCYFLRLKFWVGILYIYRKRREKEMEMVILFYKLKILLF